MTALPTVVFLGLGSNLADPAAQVQAAINAIEKLEGVTLQRQSSLYKSPPMGPAEQPDYVNAVVKITTRIDSVLLLDRLQEIENDQGRVRSDVQWGPRTIDIDILMFGNQIVETKRLKIPHPGIAERPFVVVPLAEIDPELILLDGRKVANLAAEYTDDDVLRIAAMDSGQSGNVGESDRSVK